MKLSGLIVAPLLLAGAGVGAFCAPDKGVRQNTLPIGALQTNLRCLVSGVVVAACSVCKVCQLSSYSSAWRGGEGVGS